MELTPEISDMLDDIMEQYELDTGKITDPESMVSGLIRQKHSEMF